MLILVECRHPSHPDYQSTAGAGPSSQGTTAPGTPPVCEVAPPPEPEVSQPPSKKRKGKERAVPCQESATEAAPLGTPSVDGGPQYVEGVHYTVVDHLQDGTKRPCKWSGSCSYALLMQQGVWTKHLRKNHEEDMKASQPDGRIPCKWTGCKRSYQSPSALAKHVVRNHFGKQWYCHLCRTHFSGDMSHVNRHCNKSASHLKVAKKLEDGHKPWIVERVWDEQQDADESGQGDKGEGPSQRNFKRRREEDES